MPFSCHSAVLLSFPFSKSSKFWGERGGKDIILLELENVCGSNIIIILGFEVFLLSGREEISTVFLEGNLVLCLLILNVKYLVVNLNKLFL